MEPDDALDEVEAAIRRAEELMSRDLELLAAATSPNEVDGEMNFHEKAFAVGDWRLNAGEFEVNDEEGFFETNLALNRSTSQRHQGEHTESEIAASSPSTRETSRDETSSQIQESREASVNDNNNNNNSELKPKTAAAAAAADAATRYRSREAREALIERLLREREEAVAAKLEVQQLAKEVEEKEREQREQEKARLESLENQQREENKQRRDRNTSMPWSRAGGGRPQSASGRRPHSAGVHSAKFTRKTLDQVRRQVEEERARDCTFKPRLARSKGSNIASKLRNETPEERLLRLAQPKSEYWVRFEEERAARESAELQKDCPFKPDISLAQPNEVTSEWQQRVKEAYRNHVPVEKRLHLDASERWAARERAKRELEEAEMQAQPFRPRVNPVSEEIAKQTDYEPIERRAARVQREKQERLVKKQLEFELSDGNLTFKPTINEESQRLALGASLRRGEVPSGNVVDRLLSRNNSVHERKKHREQVAAQQQDGECNFQPKVSSNSASLLRGNELYDGATNFVDRQQKLEELRRQRAQQRQAAAHDMSGVATFRPKTHRPEAILVRSRPELLAETEEQRYERLARRDQERKERLRASIREHYYSQYEHKPQINRVSAEIVRGTHKAGPALFEDLHRNERGRHYREMARSQVAEESLKDCTFKPKTLNRPGAEPSAAIRLSRFNAEQTIEHIERSRRHKELRLLEQKREQEFEELRECTFTPTVNAGVPRPASAEGGGRVGGRVVVRGLNRHLEKQELAKRQAQDLRDREAKVFLEDADRIQSAPYTVPEPFNLSRGNGPKQTGPQYSFHPQTNLKTKRRQIAQILGQ